MGYYYKFYNPRNMEVIDEGKFVGMPFYWNKLPCEIPMYPCCHDMSACYDMTGLLNKDMAIKLQSEMTDNKTLFTDMMDENETEVLIFRIT